MSNWAPRALPLASPCLHRVSEARALTKHRKMPGRCVYFCTCAHIISYNTTNSSNLLISPCYSAQTAYGTPLSLRNTQLASEVEFQAPGLEHANWVTPSQSDRALPKVYLIWKLPAAVPGIKAAPCGWRRYSEFSCALVKRGFYSNTFLLNL